MGYVAERSGQVIEVRFGPVRFGLVGQLRQGTLMYDVDVELWSGGLRQLRLGQTSFGVVG